MRDIHVEVTRNSIDTTAFLERARTPGTGGIVTFIGIVRDDGIEALELEAYTDLARADLLRIAGEARETYHLTSVLVIHRFGTLSVGEVILLIVCGAAHRTEAFRGCEWILERIKEQVPIWKKEIGPVGERWVKGYGEE